MTARPIGVEVSCDGPDEQTDCPDSAGWTVRRRVGRLRDVCPACRAQPTP
jgi:hypothetical protein